MELKVLDNCGDQQLTLAIDGINEDLICVLEWIWQFHSFESPIWEYWKKGSFGDWKM